jgi:tetratricopeptide (TPR) repeat protein
LPAPYSAWRAGAFDKRIFYYSGVLYENLSLFEESRRQYERFLKHEPADREIQMRLARLLFRMGKWKDSIGYYRKFVEKNPKDLTSLINLGLAHQRQHETDSGEKSRKTSPKEKKDGPSPGGGDLSDLKQAISFLERAAELEPNLPPGIHLTLAKLRYEEGSWERSASSCLSELKTSPDDRETLKLLSLSYEKMNDEKKLLETYLKLQDLDPQSGALRQKVKALRSKLKK